MDDILQGATAYTGTVPSVPAGSGGGDPYIYPLHGPPLKLPNVHRTYRLYQDAHVVVNATVAPASLGAQRQIHTKAASIEGLMAPVAADAFYFSELCVIWTSTGEQLHVDLETRALTGAAGQNLRAGRPYRQENPGQRFDPDNGSQVVLPIDWGVGSRATRLCVHFSRNPQVRNGVSLITGGCTGTGLLVRNFRPRLCTVPAIGHTKRLPFGTSVRKRARPRRMHSKRGLAAHREVVMLIRAKRP